jgi:hypothetical protein
LFNDELVASGTDENRRESTAVPILRKNAERLHARRDHVCDGCREILIGGSECTEP